MTTRPSHRPYIQWLSTAMTRMVAPLTLLLAVLLGWDGLVRIAKFPPYLLPSPGQVMDAVMQNSERLGDAMVISGMAAAAGFTCSLLLGTFAAFILSQSRLIRAACYPYAIFLQTVPIIAIAPLIMTWCGPGFLSVTLIAFIVSVFPVLTNATSGLISVSSELDQLFELHSASRWQRLWKLQFPSAVPAIITGARTASGASVIGAIVGEFFAGYSDNRFGLGYLVRLSSDQLKTDLLFASVIGSTLLGLAIFGLTNLIGAQILRRWYDEADHARW